MSWCVPWLGRLDDGALADNEAAVERELGVGEAEGLLGDARRDAGQLEEDGAGLDDGHVELDRALALAHADLGGLLCHGLVREHPDPELALALQVAGDR